MTDNDNVEELVGQLASLSQTDRKAVFERLQEDDIEQFLEVRGEFIETLEESGVIGSGMPDDGYWADYCREYPQDPICQRIAPRDSLEELQRKYVAAREQYFVELEERDIRHIHDLIDLCWRMPHICDPDYEHPPTPPGSLLTPVIPLPPPTPLPDSRDIPERLNEILDQADRLSVIPITIP